MSTKHTPGPWKWNELNELASESFLDESGKPAVIVQTDDGHYPPRENDRPLLAAAPDQHEFIEKVVEWLCHLADSGHVAYPHRSAAAQFADDGRRLLEKATGEQA